MIVALKRGESPTANVVHLRTTSLLFSDETIVAYRTQRSNGWVVSENIWSQTTGKHITQETRVAKEDRISHEAWKIGLYKVLESL